MWWLVVVRSSGERYWGGGAVPFALLRHVSMACMACSRVRQPTTPCGRSPYVLIVYVSGVPTLQVPYSLCHGDFHSSNMFLLPGTVEPSAICMFDWCVWWRLGGCVGVATFISV